MFFSKISEKNRRARERIERMTPTERSEELTRMIVNSKNSVPREFNPVNIEEIQSNLTNPFVPINT